MRPRCTLHQQKPEFQSQPDLSSTARPSSQFNFFFSNIFHPTGVQLCKYASISWLETDILQMECEALKNTGNHHLYPQQRSSSI